MMKRILSLLLAAMLLSCVFAGCTAKPPAPVEPTTGGSAAGGSATEPAAEEPAFTELDLCLFRGGHGDMWDRLIALFQEKYPNVKITADISDDVDTRIRTRMLTDAPPDLVVAHLNTEFNVQEAIRSDLYLPLNDLYENGVTADDRKYSDFLNESALTGGSVGENYYLFPYGVEYRNWWYDKTLFNEKGWEAPDTWAEMMDVSAKIAADPDGIAPFIYAGVHPGYLISNYLTSAIAGIGGYQAYLDCYVNLKEGAWSSDVALQAIQNIYDLSAQGYVFKGTTGIDHTQSQLEWLNNRAAFLPCGSWLEQEMKDSIPEGFDMTFLPVPIEDTEGHHYVASTFSIIGIPAKAKNIEAAKAFLGVMYSKEGLRIIIESGQLPVATDITEQELSEVLTPAMVKVVERASQPDILFVENVMESYYPTLATVILDNITDIVLMEITPEEFCANVEAAAAEARNDDTVFKYYR